MKTLVFIAFLFFILRLIKKPKNTNVGWGQTHPNHNGDKEKSTSSYKRTKIKPQNTPQHHIQQQKTPAQQRKQRQNAHENPNTNKQIEKIERVRNNLQFPYKASRQKQLISSNSQKRPSRMVTRVPPTPLSLPFLIAVGIIAIVIYSTQ